MGCDCFDYRVQMCLEPSSSTMGISKEGSIYLHKRRRARKGIFLTLRLLHRLRRRLGPLQRLNILLLGRAPFALQNRSHNRINSDPVPESCDRAWCFSVPWSPYLEKVKIILALRLWQPCDICQPWVGEKFKDNTATRATTSFAPTP